MLSQLCHSVARACTLCAFSLQLRVFNVVHAIHVFKCPIYSEYASDVMVCGVVGCGGSNPCEAGWVH
jgi:hypothetical protein